MPGFNDIFGSAGRIGSILGSASNDMNRMPSATRPGATNELRDAAAETTSPNLNTKDLKMDSDLKDLDGNAADLKSMNETTGSDLNMLGDHPVMKKTIEAASLMFDFEVPFPTTVEKDPALDDPNFKDPQSNPQLQDPQSKVDKMQKDAQPKQVQRKEVDKKQDITKLKYEKAQDPPLTEQEKKGYKDKFEEPAPNKKPTKEDVAKDPPKKSFAEWLLDKYIAYKKRQAMSQAGDTNNPGKPGNPENKSAQNDRGMPTKDPGIKGPKAIPMPNQSTKPDLRSINDPTYKNPNIKSTNMGRSNPVPSRTGRAGTGGNMPKTAIPKLAKFKSPRVPKFK